MHIINVRHNSNNRWKRKAKNRDRKKPRSVASYSESVRAKWFCCAFKLSFVQLICKASLIFKLNLQLALSIMDGDSGDKKKDDAVDDDGSDANWGDGENIVNCGEDKVGGDSIGDGGVDNNGGSDPDFGDDKTKVGYSDDTADYDDNSDNDGGPNDGGGVNTNDNDYDGDDADTDGGNDDNVDDGDKNDTNGNEADRWSTEERWGGNDEDDDKDSSRDDYDIDDIDFQDDDGVRGEFLQSNFVSITTNLYANL